MFKGLVQYANVFISAIELGLERKATNVAFVIDGAALAFHLSLWSSKCEEKERSVILMLVSRRKSSSGS